MRIDEVVRVQNPLGGDFKNQMDRDLAAAAVRAQRQANREAGKNTAGAKSGTDPQGGMFTPGAVTTKSYNNALTKQFARPAGQGKGKDLLGRPLKQPAQAPQQPAQAAPTQQSWVGQNTDIPAVQRKQQAQQQPVQQAPAQPQQPAAQPTATTGTSAPAPQQGQAPEGTPTNTQAAQPTGKVQGVKQQINPAFVKEFDGIVDVTPKLNPQIIDAKGRTWLKTTKGWQNDNRTIERDDSTYITFDNAWREANGFPTAKEGTRMGSPNGSQPTQQPTQQAQPEQPATPNEPVRIGGQKLNPNDPTDFKLLQKIQQQLPQMPTQQVTAVKKAAEKTLKRRKNKPKQRF
jgi:hypothetical protein